MNYLLPDFVHRFDPGIQMRSYLDWMMATMQLTLIRRYNFGSIFQNICITVDDVFLILLSEHYPKSVLNLFWLLFGCSRTSWSKRKTVHFMLTRVQSGTPTVFSLCSGEDCVFWLLIQSGKNQIVFWHLCLPVEFSVSRLRFCSLCWE